MHSMHNTANSVAGLVQWHLQGGFQGFRETSQALATAYSTVQLAGYSLGATGTELSL